MANGPAQRSLNEKRGQEETREKEGEERDRHTAVLVGHKQTEGKRDAFSEDSQYFRQ